MTKYVKICTIKKRAKRHSGFFIVNLEHISSVSIVDFEQVNVR